jgi:hypothetical protein
VRWRQKDPNEVERLRRLDLNRRGRITTAEIVDLFEQDAPCATDQSRRPLMVTYKYQVAGVTYEVSQDVSALPAALSASPSLASQTASIKYDPKAHQLHHRLRSVEWVEAPNDGPPNSRVTPL